MSDQPRPTEIQGVPVEMIKQHLGVLMVTIKMASMRHQIPIEKAIEYILGSFGFVPTEQEGVYKLHPEIVKKMSSHGDKTFGEDQALQAIAWQTAKWDVDGKLEEKTAEIHAKTEQLKAMIIAEDKGPKLETVQNESCEFDKETNVTSIDFLKNKKNTLH